MIRVIDRTLVLLEAFNLREPAFREIAELLCACGANFLEVTPAVYHQLGTLRGAQYILRVESPQEAKAYLDNADIKRFVCKSGFDCALRVYPEIKINDMRDFYTVERFRRCDRVRVCGLADTVLQPQSKLYTNLRSAFEGEIEFAADNDCYAATSLTLQWAILGGTEVVTSFFGMGSMAAFENVTRLLYLLKGRRTKSALGSLGQLERRLSAMLTECESA